MILAGTPARTTLSPNGCVTTLPEATTTLFPRVTPGLITDALGFLLLVPQGRAVVRKMIAARLEQRTAAGDPNVIDAEWYREE